MSAWLWAALAVGGGCGAVARFELDAWVARVRARRAAARPGVAERRLAGVPLGTLVVNVTACVLLGLFTGVWGAAATGSVAAGLLTVLGTGFCGGYSTFSTACVEAAKLLRAGKVGAGLGLAVAMTLLCQGAAVLGILAGGMAA